MTGQPVCPQCSTPVGGDWEWCHNCGFDPEGKRAAAEAEAAAVAFEMPAVGRSFPGVPAPRSLLSSTTLDPSGPDGAPGVDDELTLDDFDLPDDEHDRTGMPGSSGPAPLVPLVPLSSSDEPTPFDRSMAFDSSVPFDAPPPYDPSAPFGSSFDQQASFGSSPYPALDGSDSGAPGLLGGLPPAPPSAPNGGFGATDFTPSNWSRSPEGGASAPGSGHMGASSTRARLPLVIGAVVALIALLGFVLVKIGTEERPHLNASATDGTGPRPLGAVELNTTPTTAVTIPPAAGGWAQYRSPDGTFIAGFPQAPKTEGRFTYMRGRQMPVLAASYGDGVDGPAYVVEFVEMPTGSTFADSQAAYEEWSTSFKVSQGDAFDLGGGLSGVMFNGEMDGRSDAQGMLVSKASRVYFLVAFGADAVSLDHFFRSFRILADPGSR